MKTLLKFVLPCLLSANLYAQSDSLLEPVAFAKGIVDTSQAQVLDVRTPGEYNTGHLPNALLADWQSREEFKRRTGYLDKSKPIYVYCLVGGRSAAAAKMLREAGYPQVIELKGGINAWKAAGLKLQNQSAGQPQMAVAAFDSAVQRSGTVLVDFGADWCPPCRAMAPELETLHREYGSKYRLVKVDGGRDEELVKKYQVTTLPVFIIFRDGKQVWRKEGVSTAAEIAAHL